MLSYRMDEESGIFEIDVDGRIDADAYRSLVEALEAAIAARGTLSVLEVVRSIGWISPAVWLEDLFWSSRHMHAFSRIALVTDTAWLASMAGTAAMAFPVSLRTFALADLDKAREWLAA